MQSTQLNDSFWATVMAMPGQNADSHCTAHLLPVATCGIKKRPCFQIKFDFLADDTNFVVKSSSNLVVNKLDADREHQTLCDGMKAT